MNLITPNSGLLFWMVLIFGIVLFALAKWGFPIITQAVEERSASISDSLREAEKARAQLSDMAKEQQEMISRTKAEQGQILRDAAKAREEILEKARADAREETARMIADAKAEIERERESALRDVRREVAVLSVEVAEKVLRKELSSSQEQMALIDRLADETAKSEKPGN